MMKGGMKADVAAAGSAVGGPDQSQALGGWGADAHRESNILPICQPARLPALPLQEKTQDKMTDQG